MQADRFDQFTQVLGSTSRRGAFKAIAGTLLGGLATVAFGRQAGGTTALAKVPVVAGKSPGVPADKDTFYLFVQNADSGTFVANPAMPGIYTLTLTGVSGETIYFSDRPVRDAGRAPMQPFLDGLGFDPNNPPNAALVVVGKDGSEQTLIIELFGPQYDVSTRTLTYDATLEPGYSGAGLAPLAARQSASLPENFDDATLFIDDCANGSYYCVWGTNLLTQRAESVGSIGCCWHVGNLLCVPCSATEAEAIAACEAYAQTANGQSLNTSLTSPICTV
jgi:hypothetical protein